MNIIFFSERIMRRYLNTYLIEYLNLTVIYIYFKFNENKNIGIIYFALIN